MDGLTWLWYRRLQSAPVRPMTMSPVKCTLAAPCRRTGAKRLSHLVSELPALASLRLCHHASRRGLGLKTSPAASWGISMMALRPAKLLCAFPASHKPQASLWPQYPGGRCPKRPPLFSGVRRSPQRKHCCGGDL
jgi:hypothetical protein